MKSMSNRSCCMWLHGGVQSAGSSHCMLGGAGSTAMGSVHARATLGQELRTRRGGGQRATGRPGPDMPQQGRGLPKQSRRIAYVRPLVEGRLRRARPSGIWSHTSPHLKGPRADPARPKYGGYPSPVRLHAVGCACRREPLSGSVRSQWMKHGSDGLLNTYTDAVNCHLIQGWQADPNQSCRRRLPTLCIPRRPAS